MINWADAGFMRCGSPTVSVCICTYNRAESLRRTLQSLVAQERREPCVEILIIDNNSTDHTRGVVETFLNRLPLRYVHEGRQGLSHARNRALNEFRGSHLIFTDDDVTLAPDWLAEFLSAIRAHPEMDLFGGRILPDWRGRKPGWIGEAPLPLIDGLLVWFDLGEDIRLYQPGEQGPVGASFGLTRQMADRIGLFDINLGCKGSARGRGEDSEWVARARAAGARSLYVGRAICLHAVDPKRLTLPSLFAYGTESGRAAMAMKMAAGGTATQFLSFALRGMVQLLRGRGDRFRQCVINMGIVYASLAGSHRGADGE